MVNGIPLGPNAFSIWVDIPKSHEAFLWRPTPNMTFIKDAVNSTIAWPANKVVLEKISEITADIATSAHSVKIKVLFVYYYHYNTFEVWSSILCIFLLTLLLECEHQLKEKVQVVGC